MKQKRADRKATIPRRQVFQLSIKELKELVDGAKDAPLGEERHAALWAICLGMLKALPERHRSSEKSKVVLPPEPEEATEPTPPCSAAKLAFSSRGIWFKSNMPGINLAYKNRWFMGKLINLEDKWSVLNTPATAVTSEQLTLAF